jgi:hypothetical protein
MAALSVTLHFVRRADTVNVRLSDPLCVSRCLRGAQHLFHPEAAQQACSLREDLVAASSNVHDVTQAYMAFRKGRRRIPRNAPMKAIAAHSKPICSISRSPDAGNKQIALDRRGSVLVTARIFGSAVYGISTEMGSVRPLRVNANTYVAEITYPSLAVS